MVSFSVEIDFTFIDNILSYLEKPAEYIISQIINHEAAKGVHVHAARFGNTNQNLYDFWKEKLLKEFNKGDRHLKQILECVEYIKSNAADFSQTFKELEAYFPDDMRLTCKLYLISGYDIGIVSEGNAYLNLGHPLFYENKRELLYFAMHELHHVGYTHYNPIYSLKKAKTTRDLLMIIKYSTQLEGLAVYASFHKRLREERFTHKDYIVLNDPLERSRVSSEFFRILEELKGEPERSLIMEDFEILHKMSDRDRLWYVVGAHMAQTIDLKLGRNVLKKTIYDGPDAFFNVYLLAL